jgi:hypothetical protein
MAIHFSEVRSPIVNGWLVELLVPCHQRTSQQSLTGRRGEYCYLLFATGELMSIYATQWILQFPRYGDVHTGCEWVRVIGQGVPGHVGTPTFGYGYESGDPYASFLPPALAIDGDEDEALLRAVVVVRAQTEKVGQEYIAPLLVLSGDEYSSMPFQELQDRICSALRGNRPAVVAEMIDDTGSTLVFDDGTFKNPKES